MPHSTSSLLLLCLLLLLPSSTLSQTTFNVALSCGTCQTTTGCPSDTCMKMSGDISDQTCYDKSTCDFNQRTNVQIGLCDIDFGGTACSSQLCIYGATVDTCYSSGGFCLDGVTISMKCQNQIMSINYTGGVFGSGNSNTTSVNLMEPCGFTQATGSYSNCTGDIFGTTCDCCATISMSGLSQPTGTCVSTSAPMYKFKSTVVANSHQKHLLSTLLGLLLLIVVIL